MSDFTRKIQYLQGLADGMNATDAKAQWDFMLKLVEALGEAAQAIDDLFEMNNELNDYVESIDDDLYRLENDFDGEMEDGDYFDGADGGESEKAQLRPFPARVHTGAEVESIPQYCPHCLRGFRVALSDLMRHATGHCPHCGETVDLQALADEDALPFLQMDHPENDPN